jgi:hypothetical protein
VAPDACYGRTVRAHPVRTGCSCLRFKAFDSVQSGGTVVSPRTDDRQSYWILTEILNFHRRSGTGAWYGLVCPYRRSRKLLVPSTKLPIFFVGKGMWYRRVVQEDPTIPLVAKVTGTCELINLCAFFSHALVHFFSLVIMTRFPAHHSKIEEITHLCIN